MKVSIIGSGVVGKKIGIGLKDHDHEVIFHDIDSKTLSKLNEQNHKTNLNLKESVHSSNISFICVPTPSNEKGIDLSIIEKVSRDCGDALKDKEEYHIFVFKSTIVPGTTEKMIIPLLEEHSGKKVDRDFGVVFSPEFFTATSKSWDVDQHRIIIGEGDDKRAGDVVEKIHAPLSLPIFRRNYRTAEFIKYAANITLMSKISINNELFRVAEKLDIDGKDVSQLVSIDKRIGKYGSKPGLAFSGSCFPKDLKAFVKFTEEIEHDAGVIREIEKLNELMLEKYGAHKREKD